MKKTILGLFSALLLFLARVTKGEESSASTADLAALRAAIFQPEPVFAQTQITTGGEADDSCTVYHTCSDGTVISCSSSTGSCQSFSTYIVCDGVRKDCPPPPSCTAYVQCPNGQYMACPPGTRNCENWAPYCLMCDGVIRGCTGVTCPM